MPAAISADCPAVRTPRALSGAASASIFSPIVLPVVSDAKACWLNAAIEVVAISVSKA